MDRLVQDIEGQLLYNSGSENRVILKKALRVHDQELATADEILSGLNHPIRDCQLVVGESYYNRLSILVKPGIAKRTFDREYGRLQDNLNHLCSSLSGEGRLMLRSNIGQDVWEFTKLLTVRQHMSEHQLSKAVECAEQLIEDVRAADRELSFIGGYAHYWAGVSKRRIASDRSSAGWVEEIDRHATAARRAFSRIGNARMTLNTERDLMTKAVV